MMMNEFPRQPYMEEQVPEEIEHEFSVLMSLALDNMLDASETQRFHAYLTTYAGFAERWRQWQELDQTFLSTPSVLPPVTFVADTEMRLIQRERQRRLLWGFGLGVVVLALWVGLMAGAVSFGAFVMFNQAEWLSQLVHWSARSTAMIADWQTATANTLNALLSTSQARLFAVGYGLTAVAMLSGWIFVLRRSTRVDETTAPVLTRTV